MTVAADPAYGDIGRGLLAVFAAAFTADLLILTLPRQRTAAAVLKALALFCVNALLFFCAGVYWLGPVAIFHPHADPAAEQALSAAAGAEPVETEELSGWIYRCGEEDAPVILCFYGNGETASRKLLELMELTRQGYFTGFDLAVFDYAGYGRQPGRPTEDNLKVTALAAFDYLAERYGAVCALGYSIGTGPANYAAARRNAAALALIAPYADGYDLYQSFLPVFQKGPARALVSFKMESRVFAADVKTAPLILASVHDRAVPFSSSQALAACYAKADFRSVEVTDHNAFWQSEACMGMISDYFREAVS